MPKIAAVADIHAYSKKLDKMLTELAATIDFEKDTVVFLGDYVDGGPDAKYVVSTLMDLESRYPHWVFLKGNHEDMMIAALGYAESECPGGHYDFSRFWDGWYGQGGESTLDSYKREFEATTYEKSIMQPKDVILQDHLAWLAARSLLHETENFIFVHAGLYSNRDLSQTSAAYKLWVRDSFIYSDFDWGKKVIFGHTYHKEPFVMKNKIGIDTMHHGGGFLTAVILDESNMKEPSYISV